MKTFRIERCSDPVLNRLWAWVSFPPIRAKDADEAEAIFRASDHSMREWILLRAVEFKLSEQVEEYVCRAEVLCPVPLTRAKRADLWDLFNELVLKAENAQLRAETAESQRAGAQ